MQYRLALRDQAGSHFVVDTFDNQMPSEVTVGAYMLRFCEVYVEVFMLLTFVYGSKHESMSIPKQRNK